MTLYCKKYDKKLHKIAHKKRNKNANKMQINAKPWKIIEKDYSFIKPHKNKGFYFQESQFSW